MEKDRNERLMLLTVFANSPEIPIPDSMSFDAMLMIISFNVIMISVFNCYQRKPCHNDKALILRFESWSSKFNSLAIAA